MATTASPTPLSTSYSSLYKRPTSRPLSRNLASRPHLRKDSPLSATATTLESRNSPLGAQNLDEDLSDDDIPAPIKFSAAVKALLGEDASSIDTSPVTAHDSAAKYNADSNLGLGRSPSEYRRSYQQGGSPLRSLNGSPAPRIVRVSSGARPSSRVLERDGSFQYQNHSKASELKENHPDLITPAPRPRSIRVTGSRLQSRSPQETVLAYGSNGSSGRTARGSAEHSDAEYVVKAEPMATGTVTRPRHGDDLGAQSTMRIKRVGKMSGSFLNGPVRRGMIRRPSEEDDEPQRSERNSPEPNDGSPKPPSSTVVESRSPILPDEPEMKSPVEDVSAFKASSDPAPHHFVFSSSATVLPSEPEQIEYKRTVSPRPITTKSRSTPASNGSGLSSLSSSKSSSSRMQSAFKVPALPVLPSQHDQENEPPPTFKKAKPSSGLLDKVNKITVLGDEKEIQATPATVSPRKALAPRNQNTPHRAPPPPPKMSVLEAATATAGAAATSSQSRKKRNHVSINGKLFTRLDCIGRGGTSRVYRVMAENSKIFALKRVSLEDADPASIKGYKGEIDLLRKLENNDRVVRLYDYEINDEKQTLSVLMEVGESDLFRILNQRIKTEDARLDLNFTRFYWKEMLECVQSVHLHDIVHSDLKPANFLLIQGRLKLIDFGIANAIADDTINVHREHQIGTPNYMSPESLVDCNAVDGLPSSAGRLLKLGKPSDVWSLGCILYQMVYGQPPFAHIQKQFERIMSIPNPKVVIEFPSSGVGGVPVPTSLIRTLRRCLQRDQTLRPTVEELLSESNEFLYPDRRIEGTVPISQDVLGRILGNVINHCRQRGVPEDVELKKWPEGFFTKLKQALEEEELRP